MRTVFALCVGNTLCIRYQLVTFCIIRTQIVFFLFFFYGWTVRRLCVTGTNLGQRKHNEFRACAPLVPSVRLALVWRFSGVYIHTWKNAHIFEHAENVRRGWRTQKWMTFIRRSRQIINEFWRTLSELRRTDQNSSLFVRWTCVMVCVTGPVSATHSAQRAH